MILRNQIVLMLLMIIWVIGIMCASHPWRELGGDSRVCAVCRRPVWRGRRGLPLKSEVS